MHCKMVGLMLLLEWTILRVAHERGFMNKSFEMAFLSYYGSKENELRNGFNSHFFPSSVLCLSSGLLFPKENVPLPSGGTNFLCFLLEM